MPLVVALAPPELVDERPVARRGEDLARPLHHVLVERRVVVRRRERAALLRRCRRPSELRSERASKQESERMNQRTLYLLILMGIVFAAWFGDMAYRGLIEEPAEMRRKELARIESSLKAAKKTIVDTANAMDQLELLERISLPYDPELARSAYQDWLLDLVQSAELTGASVDAAQPISVKIKDRATKANKEIFLRYTFALRARGSLQQVVLFLFDFLSNFKPKLCNKS